MTCCDRSKFSEPLVFPLTSRHHFGSSLQANTAPPYWKTTTTTVTRIVTKYSGTVEDKEEKWKHNNKNHHEPVKVQTQTLTFCGK